MLGTESITISISIAAIVTAGLGGSAALYQIRKSPTASENHDIAVRALKMSEHSTERADELQEEMRLMQQRLDDCNAQHQRCKERLDHIETECLRPR